jgi:hypothetical protein
MRKTILILLSLISFQLTNAQEFNWAVELDYFFDNNEYANSSHAISQTLDGIWLKPSASLTWQENNSIVGGVNVLKIPGTKETYDEINLTLYYKLQLRKFLLQIGSFPREGVTDDYNRFFFTDSVSNFIPVMRGVVLRYGDDRNYIKGWYDQTGYPSEDVRESFFVGFSGRISHKILFADFQSYMFHYANYKPIRDDLGVSENMQLQMTAGIDYKNDKGFEGLVAAGALLGYERDRRFDDERYKPVGAVVRADAELWGVGTKNLLYVGDRRMRLSETFGNELYWGTPFLQSDKYMRSELYIKFIESEPVNLRFSYNVHFSEGHAMSQQMLTLSAKIDSKGLSNRSKMQFPWLRFFGR